MLPSLAAVTRPVTRPVTQPISVQSGQAVHHGTLVICYSIVNLHPWLRMHHHALQVVTIVVEPDAKKNGMTEVNNGGATSFGAQLQKLQHVSQ